MDFAFWLSCNGKGLQSMGLPRIFFSEICMPWLHLCTKIRMDTFPKNWAKVILTLGDKSGCAHLQCILNQSQYVLLIVCIKAVTSKVFRATWKRVSALNTLRLHKFKKYHRFLLRGVTKQISLNSPKSPLSRHQCNRVLHLRLANVWCSVW